MRLARLSAIGLGTVALALIGGHQAKAQTAYMWGEAEQQLRQNGNGDDYRTKEVFLLNVNLSTGAYTEVPGSRQFARTEIGCCGNGTETNPAHGFFGHAELMESKKVGNRIYFSGMKHNHDDGSEEQRLSYFDLTTQTYDFALKDGSLDSEPTANVMADFFPTGTNASDLDLRRELRLIGGQGISTGNETRDAAQTVDLTPLNARIDDNKDAIRKNKKAIDTNRTNINNLGDGIAASTALGAALSALPVTPDDAPFSCGVGSGAYSSRFAMGLGCVAKLNQRLSLNAGGSHVFGGSSNYGGGSLDSVAWRGGFVLKLGKLDSPAATNEQLQSKVKELEERNASVDAKYSAIQAENKDLRARLERLEAIALGQQPATTTASLK